MFKCVTEFVPSPLYVLICDNRNCLATAQGEVSLANEEEMQLSQRSFIAKAQKDGWMVGLDAQLCPGHGKLYRDQVQRRKEAGAQVVTPASFNDALKFGKGGGKLSVVGDRG
jgi:hypothetical protein